MTVHITHLFAWNCHKNYSPGGSHSRMFCWINPGFSGLFLGSWRNLSFPFHWCVAQAPDFLHSLRCIQLQIKIHLTRSLLRVLRSSRRDHVAVIVHASVTTSAKYCVLQAPIPRKYQEIRFSLTFEKTLKVTFLSTWKYISAHAPRKFSKNRTSVRKMKARKQCSYFCTLLSDCAFPDWYNLGTPRVSCRQLNVDILLAPKPSPSAIYYQFLPCRHLSAPIPCKPQWPPTFYSWTKSSSYL